MLGPGPSDAQFKTIKPVGDRLLVSIDVEEAKTIGGVYLPGASRNKPNTGAIIAAGDVKFVKVRRHACMGGWPSTGSSLRVCHVICWPAGINAWQRRLGACRPAGRHALAHLV